MTIEEYNFSEFEELKMYMDSCITRDKQISIEKWINESIEYNSFTNSITTEERESGNAFSLEIINCFCSTPLVEMRNDDLVYRFQVCHTRNIC